MSLDVQAGFGLAEAPDGSGGPGQQLQGGTVQNRGRLEAHSRTLSGRGRGSERGRESRTARSARVGDVS